MKKSESEVRLGIIGLGPRGLNLAATILEMKGVARIGAICDKDPAKVERMKAFLAERGVRTKAFTDSERLLAQRDVDGVLVPTSWNAHLPMAIQAVSAGKPVAMEVGGATGCEELWELVRNAEAHKANAMMLENCCYGRHELMVLNMVRQGVLGEIVHCECGYCHHITSMVKNDELVNERGWHNLRRNGDLYPTHGLGPISKILNINRGNRFLTVSSVSSNARSMGLLTHGKLRFNCGDVTITTIKCANGETILLIHSVAAPQPYSRRYRVQGTKGVWGGEENGIFIEGVSLTETLYDGAGLPYDVPHWDPMEKYYDQYEHPLWEEFRKNPTGGHGGLDTLTLRAFCNSIAEGREYPIDMYDTAAWMCITALSEQSVALGGAPVPVPDFTCGKWVTRQPPETGLYTL